ncbi:MAG TPA: DUF4168 domain-containing protein [Balneolaceae bacterium]
MKFFKYTIPLVLGFLVTTGSLAAQGQQGQTAQPDSVTNQELQKFAEISNEAQKIQQEARQTVDSLLAEENMEMQRFQEIMMSKRNPQAPDTLNITPEEQQTIQELEPKLIEMQQESQQKFVAVIQEKGLTPNRFQQIMQAIRTDPQVMKRFQNMMRDSLQN